MTSIPNGMNILQQQAQSMGDANPFANPFGGFGDLAMGAAPMPVQQGVYQQVMMPQQPSNVAQSPQGSTTSAPSTMSFQSPSAIGPMSNNPLKVKIRMTSQEQMASGAPLSSSVQPATPSSISGAAATTTTDDSNLKIYIKKSDLSGVPISVFPFLSIDQNTLSVLTKSVSSGPNSLDVWNPVDHRLLRSEIRSTQLRLQTFLDLLEVQINSVDEWRTRTYGVSPVVPAHPIAQYGTSSKVKREKKRRESDLYKSGKRDEDFDSDDDLDLMDVDDVDTRKREKKKAQSLGPGRKRQTPIGGKPAKSSPLNGANSILPHIITSPAGTVTSSSPMLPSAPTTMAGMPATPLMMKNTAAASIPGAEPEPELPKTKRKKKKKGDEDYSSGDDLVSTNSKAPKVPKVQFWADMESYFANYTEDHLKFMGPQTVDKDPIMSMPPLGKNYKELWEEQDVENVGPITPQPVAQPTAKEDEGVNSVTVPLINDNGTDTSEKPVGCLDLTTRLLASLVEENLLPVSFLPEGQPTTRKSYPTAEDMLVSLPLEAPPTYDYSYDGMLSLEQRIKLELFSIGLLKEEDLTITSNADDELSSEIRSLQSQLRDQVKTNNAYRAKVYPTLSNAVKEQQEWKARISSWAKVKDHYMKLLRKKKPRKLTAEKVEKSTA